MSFREKIVCDIVEGWWGRETGGRILASTYPEESQARTASIIFSGYIIVQRLTKKSKFLYGPVSPNFWARRSVMMILNLSSLKNRATAVVLLAGVTISGTPCPRHIIVPFGAEAPSGHVAQAWAIPPPSWGLLSQWHRQETTTPETSGASSARIQQHS